MCRSVNSPSRIGISRSPASSRAAGRSSTTTRARATVAPGSSRSSARKDPMAFRWIPAGTSPSSKTGTREVVARQAMSAFRKASAGAATAWALTGASGFAASSSAIALAEAMRRLQIRIASIGRTARIARTWVRAWTPLPNTASSRLSGRARRSVATPQTAPVRIAVRLAPSSRARGVPVAGSVAKTAPWMAGSPRFELPGKTDTTFVVSSGRSPDSQAAGITSVAPPSLPVRNTARGGAWTWPCACAAKTLRIAWMATAIGKVRAMSAARRIVMRKLRPHRSRRRVSG